MARCERIPGCPFFNGRLKGTGGMGAINRENYCEGSNAGFFAVQGFQKLGKTVVPENLCQTMIDQADKILQG
jgi:hypothetical protein